MNFYLETYGCNLNKADSELMSLILENNGYKRSPNLSRADFFIINSCGVIEKTERKIIRRLFDLKKKFKNKKIILTGCLPLISPDKVLPLVDGAIGPNNINSILKIVNKTLKGEQAFALSPQRKIDKARLYVLNSRLARSQSRQKDEAYSQSCIKIVSISDGCLGNCTYCASKFARGPLKSFGEKYLFQEIKEAFKKGAKEIQITSQGNACYGLDRGRFELPSFLEKVTAIKGDFKVRVGMMNPRFVKAILPDLITAYKSEKIYKYLHLPLQTGDNSLLVKMNRQYTAQDFSRIVNSFRRHFPQLLLATDIIIGFPGETENSFKKTIQLIKETRPHIINITKFSPRQGTKAANCKDQVSGKIKSKRSRELFLVSQKIREEDNKKFMGKIFDVLVVKKGKNNTFLARTDSFKAVVIEQKNLRIGEKQKVKIVGSETNYLLGKII